MKINTINKLINNSVWIDPENHVVYEFSNGNDLAINGKNHTHYLLNCINRKTVLHLGSNDYYLKYINDFTLELYNETEKIRIVPE